MDLTTTQLDNQGRELYQNNDNYRRLANVMEHPEFREFYNKFMQDWDSAKTIIMFMKLYEAIEKHSKIELTPYEKIAIVNQVIHDPDKRQKISVGINEWCGKTGLVSFERNK